MLTYNIMAVPKKRTSHRKRNQRRSHHALTPVSVTLCSHCASPRLNHNICGVCGYYKNRQVMSISGRKS